MERADVHKHAARAPGENITAELNNAARSGKTVTLDNRLADAFASMYSRQGEQTVSHIKHIDVDFAQLGSGVNKQKMQFLKDKVSVYTITNPMSKDFEETYTLLSKLFPADQLTPSINGMRFLGETRDGVVKENDRGEKQYVKFTKFLVRDDEGKMIATASGTFLANERLSVFYGSFVAVVPEWREHHIASFLNAATITEGNECAADAETRLGVRYPEGQNGEKIMFRINEIEFPDLRPSKLGDSLGRLIYHGKNDVCVINPEALNYVSPPTAGDGYDPSIHYPLPMFFGMRPVGGRNITLPEVREALDLMYDGFIYLGIAKEDVEAARKHSQESLRTDSQLYYRLPENRAELRDFLLKVGSIDKIVENLYGNGAWAKQALNKDEAPLELEDALAKFWNKGNANPQLLAQTVRK